MLISPEAEPAISLDWTEIGKLARTSSSESIPALCSCAPDIALARLLGCEIGSKWNQTQCIRVHPGHLPVCWADVYVPAQYADIAKKIGKDTIPGFRLMEETFGLFTTDISMDIFAGALSPPKAKALNIEPGAATLIIVWRYRDRSGQLFEVSVAEHPAARFSYSLKLRRQENSEP